MTGVVNMTIRVMTFVRTVIALDILVQLCILVFARCCCSVHPKLIGNESGTSV